MRPFTIDIERIAGETGASLSVDLSWTPDGMDLGRLSTQLCGDVSFKGNVSNVGGAFAVNGTMTAEYSGECDRCLARYSKRVRLPLVRVFSEGTGELSGIDGDDVEKMEGTVIDLAPHLREEIILSMPIRLLCKDDCKGICPDCGKDLNTGECICGK